MFDNCLKAIVQLFICFQADPTIKTATLVWRAHPDLRIEKQFPEIHLERK